MSTASTQGFSNLNTSSFPAETSITGYPNFRRTVTITANAGGNVMSCRSALRPVDLTGL